MMNASGCKTRFASTQIARRVRTSAQWQIHRAYANTRKGVIAMLKVELVEAKNNGYIKMTDIEKALRGEYKMVNSAE